MTSPTKAVILARGLGTRMRKAATAGLNAEQAKVAALGLKAMMPLGDTGRPFVDFVLSALADAGLTDICLVIGPEHDLVREYFAAQKLNRVKVSFAVQEEPLGTANALAAARSFAGDDRVVMVNSDNYYPPAALRQLVQAKGNAILAFESKTMIAESNIPADRVGAFAIVDAEADGTLRGIIEKPSAEVIASFGDNPYLSMNCFMFTPAVFDAIDHIGLSPRGEYEIIDAVTYLVAHGTTVDVVKVATGVLDMSGRGDVAAVEAALAKVAVNL